MAKKARLSLYLEDEEFKREVKVAAAKRGVAITEYCAEAIEERLIRDGERSKTMIRNKNVLEEKMAALARMDELRRKIGPIGLRTSDLINEGRRR